MRPMLRYFVTGSALLSVATLGCGEGNEAAAQDPIERPAMSDSPFKPAGLEDTIDVLAGEIDRAEAAELRLGVALLGDSEPWDSVRSGVERAFGELGADGVVMAPSEAEQAQFVEREREEASNGIGVAPLASTLEVEVELARDSGIPVVTIENDLPERDLFVGFGQSEVGQRLADAVYEATTLRDGTVIILGADDEAISPAGYIRSMAAKELLEETGFHVTIRNSSTAPDGEERDVETLTQDLLATPRPQAVLGVLETSYRIALAATAAERSLAAENGEEAPEAGLVRLKNVAFVAYGLEPATLDALEAGILTSTSAERRHYMGYVIPYVLAGLDLLGVERTKYILTPHLLDDGTLDVGMDLIRAEELGAYFEYQELLAR